MKKIIKLLSILAATTLAGTFTLSAGSGNYETQADSEQGQKHDIVETASIDGDFKVLLTAAEAAGLVETLQSKGPLTLFAPTDEAFAKLPEGTVEELLKPENKGELAAILTYHVLPGKVMAKDVKTGSASTLNGETLDIEVKDGKVTVDGIHVVATDIECTNGVIHVVDEVILPASGDDGEGIAISF